MTHKIIIFARSLFFKNISKKLSTTDPTEGNWSTQGRGSGWWSDTWSLCGRRDRSIALAKVHENSVCMKNWICARRLEREHKYARYRWGETPSRRRKSVNTRKTRPTWHRQVHRGEEREHQPTRGSIQRRNLYPQGIPNVTVIPAKRETAGSRVDALKDLFHNTDESRINV